MALPFHTSNSRHDTLSKVLRSIRLDVLLQLPHTLHENIKISYRREKRLIAIKDATTCQPIVAVNASVCHLRDGFVLIFAIFGTLGDFSSSYTVAAWHSSVVDRHDQLS